VTPGRLRALLQRAGLSPEAWARRLNAQATELSLASRIDPKTPYKWLRGATPRSPWPQLVADLLTAQLREPVTPADLGWPAPDPGLLTVSADSGLLLLPWTAGRAC
jgi:hypothetical protein